MTDTKQEKAAPDLADPVKDEPKLTVPDEPAAAAYATAVKGIMYPDRFDPKKLKLDGVDFVGPAAEEVDPDNPGQHPHFKPGA